MSTKGKRYDEATKKKIVDFVTKYNEENGRGGVTNAAKEFKITQMTINSWVKKAAGAESNTNKSNNIFQKLGDLHDTIIVKEKELEKLRKEFETLKAKVKL